MNHARTSTPVHRRSGFSLIEVSVATMLLVLLAMFLSNAWVWLGRPMLDTVHRCGLAQEADVALAYLASDLGGCLPEGSTGVKQASQFVGWSAPTESAFWLCFDSATTPNGLADWAAPDQVVVYQVSNGALLRWNQMTGDEIVVAQNVASLDVQGAGTTLELTLSLAHQGVTQTYTLIAEQP